VSPRIAMPTARLSDATETHPVRSRKRVERRRAVRFPCGLGTSRHLTVKFRDDESALVVALVRNISANGISLLVNRPLEAGTLRRVQLCRPSRCWCSDVPLRIVYSVPHPEGEFIVGASFDRELTRDELNGLLGVSRS
jgi:hypothetical protein